MTTTSIWGAAFAFATLGEVLTPTGMVGGLLITGGCVLGNMAPPTTKPIKESTTPLLEMRESNSFGAATDNSNDQV